MLFVFLLLPALAAGAGRFLYKDAGEPCDESGGRVWRCVEEAACPLNSSLRRTVDVCSRSGGARVVCCPPSESDPLDSAMAGLTKSERKCRLYSGCPTPPFILFGENADLGEFPHMVRLGYGEKNKRGRVTIWGCGGSLISDQFILTAAHCLYAGETKMKVRWANVGDLVVTTREDNAPNQIIEVVEHHVPPEYHPDRMYHDIALLKLARAVRLSLLVRPACLNRLPDPGQEFFAAGWGRTGNEFANRYSPELQKVQLSQFPLESCAKSYKGFHNLPNGVNGSMICAGDRTGKDVCHGDSGGPLMSLLGYPYCTFSLVGVVSFGLEECGRGVPSVFTRVSQYVPWIENIVWTH